jgi:hypothetical protein
LTGLLKRETTSLSTSRVQADLLDLRDFPLPFFDRPTVPAREGGVYPPPAVTRWANPRVFEPLRKTFGIDRGAQFFDDLLWAARALKAARSA